MRRARRVRSALALSVASGDVVTIDRRSRPGRRIGGIVLAVGTHWALVWSVEDGGYFDGWVAIRLSDVDGVRNDETVASAFARTQAEWPPRLPPLAAEPDLGGLTGPFPSLLSPRELVGIERKKYDATWIGLPDEIRGSWLYLWEIRPDAAWHDRPRGYRMGGITLISLGSRYLRALASIAPEPPSEASRHWPSAAAGVRNAASSRRNTRIG